MLRKTYTSINSSLKTQFTYDTHGNRATISDPDAGTITTLYDAFGQVVLQVDAGGDSVSFEYDHLGRMIQSSNNRGPITYLYYSDTTKAWFGKLQSVVNDDASITESYSYEETNGRLRSITKEIDSKSFTSLFTYDWYGRPFTKTYHSGYNIMYDYNENGDLKSISAKGKKLWECNSVNEFGQISSCTRGNYNTIFEFDCFGRLEEITTDTVFILGYDFDDAGNLS